MKNNRFIAYITIISVMLVNLSYSLVFAANDSVNIDSAVVDPNNVVTVACTVTSPTDNQRVVVMVAESKDGVVDYSSIAYINQFDYYDGFSASFIVDADNIDGYVAVVGGNNISTAAYSPISRVEDNVTLPTESTTEAATTTAIASTITSTETTTVISYSSGGGGGGGGGGSSSKSTTTTTEVTTTTETTTEATTTVTTSEQTTEATTADLSTMSVSRSVTVQIGSRSVTIDGESYDMDVAPYIQTSSSSTMVPLRFVALAISGGGIEDADNSRYISWDSDTKTATVITDYKTVSFTAGSNDMVINGSSKQMDNGVRSEIRDGRMFIPFRAVGEALGATVDWIADTKTAVYSVK